jgi:hypothetical protein
MPIILGIPQLRALFLHNTICCMIYNVINVTVTVALRGITNFPLVWRQLYWRKLFLFSFTLQMLQKFGLTLFTKILLIDSLHQCWVVLKIREKYLPVIILGILTFTCQLYKNSLTNLKKSPNQTKESQVLCQYFSWKSLVL